LTKLRKPKIEAVLSPLAKPNQLLSLSHVINIENVETKHVKRKDSYLQTAQRELGVYHGVLLNCINK